MLVATFLVNMGKVPSLGDIPADADTLNALISPIELSLLYLVGYIILLLTGPGRFSLDGALLHKR
jgi:uncharacterized membrane protein YphA (DoxX/SURF4 family)